jgi:predicted permease
MAEVLPAMPEKDAGEFKKRVISVEAGGSGWTFLRLQFAKPLWVLMVLVGLVLLIACANLANLLLARGAARRKEIAVRMAIGAGRARIIRQLLTESLLLATAGGLLGIVFASWTSGLLAAFLSRKGAPVVLDVQPDAQVLAFTVAMVLVTSLLFGLIPAWLAARAGVGPALKGGSHAIQGADRRFGLGRALLVIQVALSVVLVLGSVLFSGSLRNLKSIDPGFQTGHVVLMSMDTDHLAEKDKALTTLYNRILERVQQMPGVRAASVVNVTPLSGYGWSDVAKNPGETPPQEQEVSMNSVGPRYFEATGTPIQSGRDFDSHDRDGAPKVAIINDLVAKRLFPCGNALGGQLQVGTTNPDDVGLVTVIGIVKNAKYLSLRDPAPPTIYIAHTQGGPSSMTFVIRTTGDFGPVVRQFRSLAHELAPRAPVPEAVAMEEIVDDSLGTERLIASLSAFFGVLALLLTCIGLYGVLAYTVARRTGEIGIRMALGAQGRDVFWLGTRETGVLVATGWPPDSQARSPLTAGDKYAVWSYGNRPWIITVGIRFVIAACIAGFVPTHRGSRVEPRAPLRYE